MKLSHYILVLLLSTMLYLPDSVLAQRRGGGAVRTSGYRGVSAGHYGGGGYSNVRSGGSVVGPRGGVGSYNTNRNTAYGAYGGVRQTGSTSGSYTTQRGSTINYGAAGGTRTGPGGVTTGRGIGGVQVNTASGQTYNKVGTARGVVGPGGVGVGSRSSVANTYGPAGVGRRVSGGTTIAGPGGSISNRFSQGVAVGPGGAIAGGSRGTVARGPGGTVATRGSVAATSSMYGSALARQRTTVATGRYGTVYRSNTMLRTQGFAVRNNFRYYNTFSPTWYRRYPGAWYAAGWTTARIWAPVPWTTVYTYCGFPAQPIYYDYGTTIVYEGDTVYVNGQQSGSVQEYAQQATQISDAGRDAMVSKEENWQPLGVFALVQGDEEKSYKIFQLSINKQGVIRGNYYDALADTTTAVYGSVDKKTQRAAWSIGEKNTTVFEAGIANLTKEEAPVLVHFGDDNTQQFTLVRLEQPEDQKQQPQG